METMNAVTPEETNTFEFNAALLSQLAANALSRARLYHFFELALAHPGEEGYDYFHLEATEKEFQDIYSGVLGNDEMLLAKGATSASAFFSKLQNHSYEDVEAAHISLFSANYPYLPCPPYGSLFTSSDSDKRLEEMLAIKGFYQQNGVDIADSFDDLPDHLCVELEFSQLLCFRENEASANKDFGVLAGIWKTQTEFLDKFLLPLGNNLAELAAASKLDNLYGDLLEAMRCFLLQHRGELDATVEPSSLNQESQS